MGSLSLSKDKIKIVLLENIHLSACKMFEEHGYGSLKMISEALSGARLAEAIRDAHMIGIRSRTHLSQAVLKEARKLMAIGCFCIGTAQVDLRYSSARGIPVFNAPHSNTRSVAEMVIGLTIMLMRDIFPRSLSTHKGIWNKTSQNSFEIRGKILGIIGYGHIGSQVSILAEALGMQVLYYDINTKLPLGNAKPMESLEAVLAKADLVTLHVPEDTTTEGMIDGPRLEIMREGAALINASRGRVVDNEALAAALKSGHLRGAAVDVFPSEPRSQDEAFDNPLIGLDSAILTPHVGGSTREAQENIGAEVASKLVFFSDRGSTDGAVNFPGVNLQPNERAHRILHIHQNKPGMLEQINHKVAARNINIHGQSLETRNNVGYVVLDISKDVPRNTLSQLKKELAGIDGTIRTRVLY